MTPYALTIFVSAFLLFLLQLIMAKQILPWFGGSAAVWTTCLVFFQSALLFGYAYADWSIRYLLPRRQAMLHVSLLVLSLTLLPIIPDASWKIGDAGSPIWRILGLLAVTIGLPFFLLASTSPLIQGWFARSQTQRSPYQLFAISNLASMLALLGYPLVIEPWLTTAHQAQIWMVVYGIFVTLCSATIWFSLRSAPAGQQATLPVIERGKMAPPSAGAHLLWAALAAMGSFLLLAVTNHLSQDVVAIPLLWILPLSIYLLTFILCFDERGWYRRNLFLGLLVLFVPLLSLLLSSDTWFKLMFQTGAEFLLAQISLFLMGLFCACMFCHGELNRLRPDPRYLTRFYLMVALGGAVGAIMVGIGAPVLLPGLFEPIIGLIMFSALVLYQMRRGKRAVVGVTATVLLFTVGSLFYQVNKFTDKTLLVTRNFYGVLSVHEKIEDDPEQYSRSLTDGVTLHGNQYPNGRWRYTPTTYYSPTSGIGYTLGSLAQPSARVGVIGLGAGTLAAYGRPGDVYRFYEINPAVINIAREKFSYLSDSAAKIEIVAGDARVNLEREPGQQFTVLVVDAFSSDAIPIHLITSEALEVYLKHLQPYGVIAFHASSKFLNLVSVVQRLADQRGLKAVYIVNTGDGSPFFSEWVMLTREQTFVDLPAIKHAASPMRPRHDWPAWTDNFNNILHVFKEPYVNAHEDRVAP